MQTETYPFTIGNLHCLSVNDGYRDYGLEAFFATAPADLLREALVARGAATDKVVSPYASLYVATGNHHVLIDTGGGAVVPGVGNLPSALAKVGIQADEVDIVIITHAHIDHIGGLLSAESVPVFPNAHIYTWKKEWDFWQTEEAEQKYHHPKAFEFVETVIRTLGDRFKYIEPDCDILPGIRALAAPGHAPGQFAVRVTSGRESVIYITDAVLHPLHLSHPDWLPMEQWRLDPEEYLKSQKRLLETAVEDDALVLGMHFEPFPSLGRVSRRETGWEWVPIER